jgi:hypothetical protein
MEIKHYHDFSKKRVCQALWYTPVIPVVGRWKQEDHKFKAILCYITGSRLAWATYQDKKKNRSQYVSNGSPSVILKYHFAFQGRK